MKEKKSKKAIVMFWPYVSPKVIKGLSKVLKTRWIGQGPTVEELERFILNEGPKLDLERQAKHLTCNKLTFPGSDAGSLAIPAHILQAFKQEFYQLFCLRPDTDK